MIKNSIFVSFSRIRIMSSIKALLFGLLLSIFQLTCSAQSAEVGKLSISGAYARETVAGQGVTSGFLKIKNLGAADQLLSATTDSATEVQLHTMKMEGNVMKMNQLRVIEIAEKSTTELTPQGMHLMIMGLKGPLKAGDRLKIKLRFALSGEVEVVFPVQPIAPMSGQGHDGMKM